MVKRTSVNLDMDLVSDASDVLGTQRTTDTIHQAMRDVVRRRRLLELAQHDFGGFTLADLEPMRRPRTFEHLEK